MPTQQSNRGNVIGRGVVVCIEGTAVMTAFQKFVEMLLTQREESYAPANFAEEVSAVDAETVAGRRRLKYVTHSTLGAMWRTAYGVAATRGVRGRRGRQCGVAVVYVGDVVLNIALGLYHPDGGR
jgi:hypothetical protein